MFDRDTLLAAHDHRHVRLDGALNVRDLGGLATFDGKLTRHGVLFRADTLAHLTAADQVRLGALGLTTVVDLRTDEERVRAPDRLPEGPAPVVQALGFLPRGNVEMFSAINAGRLDAEDAVQAMMAQYRNLALEHHDRYQAFVETLLGPGSRPLLFHCASGKDRTGIAAAIVLLALDVPRATVLEDYAISNFQRRPIDLFTAGASAPAVEQVMAANPRYLEAAFKAMEEASGSIQAYLAELGLDSEARRHLRALLVA
jgi:protein-tyrosine phosphatase